MRAHLGEELEGPYGRAVRVIVDEAVNVDQTATVACWFVTAPGQSPAWDQYSVAVVHLRPIEGESRPPTIRVPGATHEFLVLALDPTPGREPVMTDPSTWHYLSPINVSEQVELPSDEAAAEMLRQVALAVVHGILPAEPPLAGAVEPWRTSLIKTAAHMRGEPHAP